MSRMATFYMDHNGDDMTVDTLEALTGLTDGSREGALTVHEVAALSESPMLREWAAARSAAYGPHVLHEMFEGREPQPMAEWLGTMRPEIAAAALSGLTPLARR